MPQKCRGRSASKPKSIIATAPGREGISLPVQKFERAECFSVLLSGFGSEWE
jgi:hypothetical protein